MSVAVAESKKVGSANDPVGACMLWRHGEQIAGS